MHTNSKVVFMLRNQGVKQVTTRSWGSGRGGSSDRAWLSGCPRAPASFCCPLETEVECWLSLIALYCLGPFETFV